jgi:hypothetical protein
MQKFDEKLPIENIVLAFNFTGGLAPGETLTGSPTVTITVLKGTDPNPNAIANGAAAINATAVTLPNGTVIAIGMAVLVPVKAGLDLNDYLIVAECATTNALKVLAWPGVLPVRAEPDSD